MAKELFHQAIDAVHRNVVHTYLTRGDAQVDREIAHERALELMEMVQRNPLAMKLMDRLFSYDDPLLHTEIGGVQTRGPLGIAAGFDKDARVIDFLGKLFHNVTFGSVTEVPYAGNPRFDAEGNRTPRIDDLPQNIALRNRMGFPGAGADTAVARLAEGSDKPRDYVLIGNVAASRPSFERGTVVPDYVTVAEKVAPYVDILEPNVSSPNTPGVRGLQEPEAFEELAAALNPVAEKIPVFYKFSPDLPKEQLERDIQISLDNGAYGVTVTNTTTDPEIQKNLKPEKHKEQPGGISGAPLTEKALQVSRIVFEYTGGTTQIKRAGGIRTVEDVWDALIYGGARVVDVYTAFVRKETSTPNFARNLMKQLAEAMRAENMQGMADFKTLQEQSLRTGKKIPFPDSTQKRLF